MSGAQNVAAEAVPASPPRKWLTPATIIVLLLSVGALLMLQTPAVPLRSDVRKDFPEYLKQAISVVIEVNKYLVSLSTLAYGAIGFIYNAKLVRRGRRMAFIAAAVLLGATHYFAFRAYAALISELSLGFVGLTPGSSLVIHSLEQEVVVFFGAVTVMALLIIDLASTPEKPS
ncbi:MAG TPA: hypothetical protein VJ276_07100 [Thermoanaerobaculia bacterium]|nr:hypothetical protein [Thermoanaerobaculia bacterium]